MRYFTYIADQSFKTAPNGERLYLQSGIWSRPYVIPDAQTEQRLHRRLTWLLRIMLGGMIVLMPVLVLMAPHIIENPLYFVGGIVAVTVLSSIASKLVMAPELKHLERAEQKLPASSFYGELARKQGFASLALGLATCLSFAGAGLWMVAEQKAAITGLICTAIFGAFSVGWGYALWLKRSQTNEPVSHSA